MSKTALVVSGYTEQVNDGSPIWLIADQLLALGYVVTRRQWDTLTPKDLCDPIDLVVTYSYGQASLWHSRAHFDPKNLPAIRCLAIIAGVPRVWWGQLYGTPWTCQNKNIASGIAFNIIAIPESAPIHDPIPLPQPPIALAGDRGTYINVNCDGPGVDHTTIPAQPIVFNTILAVAQKLLAEKTAP